jgi:hypothetical protein
MCHQTRRESEDDMPSQNLRHYFVTVFVLGLVVLAVLPVITGPVSSQPALVLQAPPPIVKGAGNPGSGFSIAQPMNVATPTATATLTPTPSPTPSVSPTPVPQIRLSDNPIGNPWLYLWDQPSGRLFEGPNTTGRRIAFFDIDGQQGRIHRGASATGEILFTIDFPSGRIWAGPNTNGPLLYTLELVPSGPAGPLIRVHEGNAKGPTIYTIRDDDMYEGPFELGSPLLHGSDPLRGPIQFLLPLLADRRIR